MYRNKYIPPCHIETIIRSDNVVASYMVVETGDECPKTKRTLYWYNIVMVSLETKEQKRYNGYTSKDIDGACSYVRSLCKNKYFGD